MLRKITDPDDTLLAEEFKLRGANYRKVMDEVTPMLSRRANELISSEGKFTPRMIATLAIEFNLPAKTTCEFLEYARILPSGTWDRLENKGQNLVRSLIPKHSPLL